MSTALIAIALPIDGPPTVTSTGITPDHTVLLARVLAELQTQLLVAATTPASPTPSEEAGSEGAQEEQPS